MQTFDNEILLYKSQIQELKKYSKYMSILIAEDYKELQKSLKKLFSLFFAKVDTADNGEEALELYKKSLIASNTYDILFSDIVMPKLNGLELTKKVKSLNPKQDIIIFSSHQDSSYLLEFINIGIKRFVTKPILLKPLLEALIAICKDIDEEKLFTNKFILSQNSYYLKKENELFVEDKQVKISIQEIEVLEFLISKVNTIVSNEELITFLYARGIDVGYENIRKMIYKLRKKLPQEAIETIHGVGYKLVTYER